MHIAASTCRILVIDDGPTVATRPQGPDEHLFDTGEEAAAVDRTIDHARRRNLIPAQGGQKGERAPTPERDVRYRPVAPTAAAEKAGHVDLGPGFIDEDQVPRIIPPLILAPPGSPVRISEYVF